MGATVDVVDAYTNVIPADAADQIGRLRAKPTWITFTSGSTVKNWLASRGPRIARRRAHRQHRTRNIGGRPQARTAG